jgi:hypothetical protein
LTILKNKTKLLWVKQRQTGDGHPVEGASHA